MNDGATILIADDEPAMRKLLTYTLLREGFRVREAEDGEGVFDALRGGLPDLLILDVMMPGLDGYDVCARLRGDPATRDLPVLLLTARDSLTDRRRAVSAGADAYFSKTCDRRALLDGIRRLLSLGHRGSTGMGCRP